MTDIASLGLEIRSDGVVVATDRLGKFRKEASLAEGAAGSLKRLATMGLAALAAGFAAFGVGIGAAVARMEQMRKLSAQVDQALKNSGNTAQTSASEIEAWADKLEARTGRAAEEIMGVATNLASYGFSRQAFFRALSLADDMSAAWGGDMKQNLEGLARALAEPEKGLAMLTKRGITFTDEQKKMIAGFVQVNDLAGAQGVVFDALEAQVKGVAERGFGGLQKAMHNAQKIWEDAFESLVRGDGKTGDLRDTLVTLAETVSSPEFISAVMGFGGLIVQAVNAAAQAVVALWGQVKRFLDWLKAQQPGNMTQDNLETKVSDYQARIDKAQKQLDGAFENGLYVLGRNAGGVGGSPWLAQDGIDKLKRQVAEWNAELAKRNDPSKFDVNGVVGGLGGANTFDGDNAVANMWKFMSPGTLGGQDLVNPYADTILGGADKDKAAEKARKAYDDLTLSAHQFIGEQQLQSQALGMTAEAAARLTHEQDMLNQAANDNLNLSPKQREAIKGLAEDMAAAEEQTRRLTEIYDTGKQIFSSFFGDLKSGIEDGKGLWQSLGDAALNALDSIASKAMEMAANGIWDMIFNGIMSGMGGGSIGSAGNPFMPGINGPMLPSFDGGGFTGSGSRSGGMDGKGGFPALLHPNETVNDHTKGAANQNQANDNREVTVRLIMPEGWQAEVLDQAGQNAVKIVQANDTAQRNYRQNGGN